MILCIVQHLSARNETYKMLEMSVGLTEIVFKIEPALNILICDFKKKALDKIWRKMEVHIFIR